MPLFEITHAAPLTEAQKADIALAVTKLQTGTYGTPSVFVTIVFRNASELDTYVAGKVVSSARAFQPYQRSHLSSA